jgi:hypothetical protein
MLNKVHLSQRGLLEQSTDFGLAAKTDFHGECPFCKKTTCTIEKTKPRVTGGRKATGPSGWDSRVALVRSTTSYKGERK